MLRILLALTATATLAGCGAVLVQSAGSNGSRYAPLDDGRRLGLVKYEIDNENYLIKRRREDAYKKMYQSCGGPYLIVAEGPQTENGRVVTTVREAAGTVTTRDGSSSSTPGTAQPKPPVHDTHASSAERITETTRAVVEEHWWYVQYRCATADDMEKR